MLRLTPIERREGPEDKEAPRLENVDGLVPGELCPEKDDDDDDDDDDEDDDEEEEEEDGEVEFRMVGMGEDPTNDRRLTPVARGAEEEETARRVALAVAHG